MNVIFSVRMLPLVNSICLIFRKINLNKKNCSDKNRKRYDQRCRWRHGVGQPLFSNYINLTSAVNIKFSDGGLLFSIIALVYCNSLR